MFRVRPRQERGYFDHGWLKSFHTFSFAGYRDPEHMGFRNLRVMNEDWVAPGKGFGTHPHHDMEIVTYVLEGAIEHRDSMGNGEVLRPGEFQRMSAGTGITHSEFNPAADEQLHLYQIWLLPERKGITPSYEQKTFAATARQQNWQRVASSTGAEDALRIHTDAEIFLANLTPQNELTYTLQPGRHAWLQVLRGVVQLAGTELQAGDGVAISEETQLVLTGSGHGHSEVMLFDLS